MSFLQAAAGFLAGVVAVPFAAWALAVLPYADGLRTFKYGLWAGWGAGAVAVVIAFIAFAKGWPGD
jgi:predicted signal transduction protein with EAL and GGDEF domain